MADRTPETRRGWCFGTPPQDVTVVGEFVAAWIGECTCFGGSVHGDYVGHEPHCGLDYIGELGEEFAGAIMWDFSFVGSLAVAHA